MGKTDSLTSLSLLIQIKNGSNDGEAWQNFVERYGGRIYQWCLSRKLQPADAEDVSQIVLLKLARRLKSFEYDASQSFRGWLRRVTENAINDFFNEQQKNVRSIGGSDISIHLQLAEARDELTRSLTEVYDIELLEEAQRRIRTRVSEKRYLAWDLATKHRLSGVEIAKQLDMKVASVYTAKNQVQNLLKNEIQFLEQTVKSSF